MTKMKYRWEALWSLGVELCECSLWVRSSENKGTGHQVLRRLTVEETIYGDWVMGL